MNLRNIILNAKKPCANTNHVYGFVYMRYLEKANLWRKKAGQGLPGPGEAGVKHANNWL